MAKKSKTSGSSATVNREALLAATSRVAGALPNRPTSLVVLNSIHVKFEGGLIYLSATDLEFTAETHADADITGSGSFVVPGKKFVESIRGIASENVILEESGKTSLLVKGGSARILLRCNDLDSYPQLPEISDKENECETFSVPSVLFRAALKQASVSASLDESKSFLCGVNLTHDRMAATDGHRLSLVRLNPALRGIAGDDFSVIVPIRTIREVSANATGDEIAVAVTNTAIQFKTATDRWHSRLIAEKFPDVEKVIPKTFTTSVSIPNRALLAEAVSRLAPFSNTRSRSVELSLSSKNLSMHVESPEFGEADDAVEVEYAGDPFKISFNIKYLLDAVKSFQGASMAIQFASPIAPCVLTSSNDSGYSHILMPLRP